MTETIRIPLGPSGTPVAWATVDLADYERLIIHRWYLSGRGYAFRTSGGRSVFMHREVLEFPDSEDINHINDDQLDNRRANLEACTHTENVRAGKNANAFAQRERISELRSAGWLNGEIAGELGISESAVVRYAKHLPSPAGKRKTKWTAESLVAAVLKFHDEHGRVPGTKDFNGKNGLPIFTQIYRTFPSVVALREAAGLGAIDFRKTAA